MIFLIFCIVCAIIMLGMAGLGLYVTFTDDPGAIFGTLVLLMGAALFFWIGFSTYDIEQDVERLEDKYDIDIVTWRDDAVLYTREGVNCVASVNNTNETYFFNEGCSGDSIESKAEIPEG